MFWFFGILTVSEHSRNEVYRAYWVKKCTARLLSHTSWKNVLPKLINNSSYKLETFEPIFGFSNFFENYSSGYYNV